MRAGGLLAERLGSRWRADCDGREGLERSLARCVDRSLRGAAPAQLPVEPPTRFVLALNLATARALGIAFPQSLILQAGEAIR